MTSLDDFIERTVPATVYVPARVSLLKLLGKGERELSMLRELLPGGGRAIDVGANKGTYTSHLVSMFDRVEAFEPIPSCAALLRRFGRRFPTTLAVHECALGREPGVAELVVPERRSLLFSGMATAYARIGGQPSGGDATHRKILSVLVRRLDDFDFDDVRFIKIDVEGFEGEVLAGAERTIQRWRPTLLVEIEQRHLRGSTVDDIVRRIVDWNYEARFLSDGRLHEFSEFRPDAHQAAAPHGEASAGAPYINNFFFFPS